MWDTLGVLLSAVLFGLPVWAMPAITAVTCGKLEGTALAPAACAAAYSFTTTFGSFAQALGSLMGGRLADSFPTFTVNYLVAAGVAVPGAIGALPVLSRSLSEGPCIL